MPIEIFSAPLDATRFDAALARSAWLVDAILGTGATGEPKSPLAEAIDRMNEYAAAGVQRFVLNHELFDDLEQIELLGQEIIPKVGA